MIAPSATNDRALPTIDLVRRTHPGDRHALTLLRVATATGLVVDVLPDRGLDLGAATYLGAPVAWMSGAPLRHPADLAKNEWGERFVGGLLATCGLDNVGPACTDEGAAFPQHGRIGGEAASTVDWGTRQIGAATWVWVSGEVAQPETTLRLHRTLLVASHRPALRVWDRVVNHGTRPEPLMLQYHCNFGAPFVAVGGRLIVPAAITIPRDVAAAEALDRWNLVEEARAGEIERVFRHQQSGQGWATCTLLPPPDGPAASHRVEIRYRRRRLPWLWQWRLLSTGSYVIGLEPANCAVKPRDQARNDGALPMLPPGARIAFDLEIALQPQRPLLDCTPNLHSLRQG